MFSKIFIEKKTNILENNTEKTVVKKFIKTGDNYISKCINNNCFVFVEEDGVCYIYSYKNGKIVKPHYLYKTPVNKTVLKLTITYIDNPNNTTFIVYINDEKRKEVKIEKNPV